MNQANEKFELLKLEMKNHPPFVQETKLRRFLSKTPNIIDAWVLLIEIIQSNNNTSEAVRISRKAFSIFTHNLKFRNYHKKLLLKNGFFDEAQKELNRKKYISIINFEDDLDLLELNFFNKLTTQTNKFRIHLQNQPSNFRAFIGDLSYQSIKKNGMPSICFLLIADWHWTIQKSIIQSLDKQNYSYYITTQTWMLRILQPTIVVLSDAEPMTIKWIRTILPFTQIVSTRHGLGVGGKNYGLYAAAATDFICVSSESIKTDLCNDALINEERVWVTGFSQMDNLFKYKSEKKRTNSNVTFAPTFDLALSSISVIGDDPVYWIRRDNKNINITIRPHPHLIRKAPLLIKRWISIYNNNPNVKLDIDPMSDLSSLLQNTDLLISDVSSVALQFMALNRPIICILDIEKARLSSKYAPEELEWKMHSATILLQNKYELNSAVVASLNGIINNEIIFERNRIRDYLFNGFADGNSGQRIAMNLINLLGN
jgi:hypothetical protein